jgi:hypothetical protein
MRKEENKMLLWNTIHFAGLGCQIAAGLAGAFSLSWIRVTNGNTEICTQKLKQTKLAGKIALAFFTLGALLLLFYEIHVTF